MTRRGAKRSNSRSTLVCETYETVSGPSPGGPNSCAVLSGYPLFFACCGVLSGRMMFGRWVAHRGPQPQRRCIYWFIFEAKLARFESAGASAIHVLPFNSKPRGARDMSFPNKGMLSTSSFVGPFCTCSIYCPALAQQPNVWVSAPNIL